MTFRNILPRIRTIVVVTAAVLLAAVSFPIEAQTPKVRIAVYRNAETGDSSLDALTSAMMNQIAFSLRLLGRYEVAVKNEPMGSLSSPAELDSVVRTGLSQGFDAIVSGGAAKQGDAKVIEAAALDLHESKITVRESAKIESVFEIFDLADAMEVLLLEGITKEHIGYGSLRITHGGTGKRSFSVFIDNNLLGTDITIVPRILAGRRRVVLKTSEGSGENFLDTVIDIPEKGSAEIVFHQPSLTPKEETALKALGSAIRERGLSPLWWTGQVEFDTAVEEARGFVEGIDNAEANEKADLFSVLNGWRTVRDLPIKKRPAQAVKLDGFRTENPDPAFTLSAAAITVDGNPDDWKDVFPIYRKTQPAIRNFKGHDIEEVKAAIDPGMKTLYILAAYRTSIVTPNVLDQWDFIFDRRAPAIAVRYRQDKQLFYEIRRGTGNKYTADYSSYAVRFSGRYLELSVDIEKAGIRPNSRFWVYEGVKVTDKDGDLIWSQEFPPGRPITWETETFGRRLKNINEKAAEAEEFKALKKGRL